MKLWEKGINPEPAIIEFTAGKDRKTDLALTKWDIVGSMANVIMLQDVGHFAVRVEDVAERLAAQRD